MQKRNISFDTWYEQNKNLRFVNELSEGRKNIKNKAIEAVQNIVDYQKEAQQAQQKYDLQQDLIKQEQEVKEKIAKPNFLNFYSMPTEKFVAEYEKLTNTKLNLDKKGKIQFHKDSVREAIRQGATVDEKVLKDLGINPEYVDKRKFEDRNSNEQMLNQEDEIRPRIANDNETIESLVLDQTKLVPDKKELKGTSKVRNYIFSRKDFDLLGEVPVECAGVTLVFSKSNVRRGAKTARSNYENRQFYVELKQAVKRALHGGFVKTDEKEKHSTVLGQDVYFTSISFNEKIYAVEIKVDVPKRQFDNKYNYAGHRVKEVNIKEIEKNTGSINQDVLSPHASGNISIAQFKKIFNNNFVEFKTEKQLIKQQAVADGTFMKAPNGKDSNLPEQLWLTVRTKAFKSWFGDWENDPKNASKVVDENGEPLVVYHGTNAEFSIFEGQKIKNTSEGAGFYFTPNKNLAQGFGNIKATFLNIRNPQYAYGNIDLVSDTYEEDYEKENKEAIDKGLQEVKKKLEKKGYKFYKRVQKDLFDVIGTQTQEVLDGLLYLRNFVENENLDEEKIYNDIREAEKEVFKVDGYTTNRYGGDQKVYVAFTSNQIKSINNRGSFDNNNPDIYFQSAMYKNKATDIISFVNLIQSKNFNGKTFYQFFNKDNIAFDLISDTLLHDEKKHPDLTAQDWADIEQNIDNIFDFDFSSETKYDAITSVKLGIKGKKAKYGVCIEILKNGRILVTTGFKNKLDGVGVQQWIDKKEKSSKATAPLSLGQALDKTNVVFFGNSSNISIKQIYEYVNNFFNQEMFFQDAYHGTPHIFEEFSTEKIGTGEGALAHGWGLYASKNKETADFYRFKLTPKTAKLYIDPKDFTINDKEHYYIKDGKFYRNNFDDTNEQEIAKTDYSKALKKAQDLNKKAMEEDEKKGQLFKVDIPENDVLLDEDKTFDEQPEKVKEALNKLIEDNMYRIEKSQLKGHEGEYELIKGREIIDIYDDIEEANKALKENNDTVENSLGRIKQANGRQIYNIISDYLGIFKSDRDTSLLLNKYGIKGITYDGRQDGRCFVIFDDKAIKVLEKFYQSEIKQIEEKIFVPNEKLNEDFQQEVKKVKPKDSYKTIDMGKLPPLYKVLGIIDDELKTDTTTIKKSGTKHNVDKDTMENLLSLVYNPKAVFKSLSTSKNPNGYVAVLDKNYIDPDTKEVKPIVAILSPSAKGKGFTLITSVYERDQFDNFIENTVAEDKVLYVDNKNGSDIWGKVSYFARQNQIRNLSVLQKSDIVKRFTTLQQEQQKDNPRGATTIFDRQYWIELYSSADKSTLLHESTHAFLSEVLYFANGKNPSPKILSIKKQLDDWLGLPENNGRYSKRQQELFAKSSETYFREGKAPTAKLKTVFERFKKWLTNIYDSIKDDLPKINDDVRELFDTILSRSYDVPDSNIYAGKEKAIKEVIRNIQNGVASEVDGITIDDVYNLLNVAYVRKPSKPTKNLKQLLNEKNIYNFDELNKAGAESVLQMLKDGGYVKEDATAEQAVDLAKKALDGSPVYRLADQWRVAGDVDFARNLRILEKVIEFSQIDNVNNGGVIDFHYNPYKSDYTSRIIENELGKIDIKAPNELKLKFRI